MGGDQLTFHVNRDRVEIPSPGQIMPGSICKKQSRLALQV